MLQTSITSSYDQGELELDTPGHLFFKSSIFIDKLHYIIGMTVLGVCPVMNNFNWL